MGYGIFNTFISKQSPSNKTMARKTVPWVEFELPSFPETGLWTAWTFYNGQVRCDAEVSVVAIA